MTKPREDYIISHNGAAGTTDSGKINIDLAMTGTSTSQSPTQKAAGR